MRIVSLLPSATEIICLLGLRDQLVGVTHECDYPGSVIGLPQVTASLIPEQADSIDIDRCVREQLTTKQALYRLNMPVLEALRPDLIITQALCDVCAVAAEEVEMAACSLPGRPQVINLEPQCLDDVLKTITRVGEITGRRARATQVVTGLSSRIERVQTLTRERLALDDRPRTAFLEWIDPPFGPGHWNVEMIAMAGGKDMLGQDRHHASRISWDRIMAARPEVMLISCCGFDLPRSLQDMPLLARQAGWNALPCVSKGRVYVVDGNAYFSRPGPRLVDSLEILAHALHPDVHPLPDHFPEMTWRSSRGIATVSPAGGYQ